MYTDQEDSDAAAGCLWSSKVSKDVLIHLYCLIEQEALSIKANKNLKVFATSEQLS